MGNLTILILKIPYLIQARLVYYLIKNYTIKFIQSILIAIHVYARETILRLNFTFKV